MRTPRRTNANSNAIAVTTPATLKVQELKNLLASKGLSTKGLKNELTARWQAFLDRDEESKEDELESPLKRKKANENNENNTNQEIEYIDETENHSQNIKEESEKITKASSPLRRRSMSPTTIAIQKGEVVLDYTNSDDDEKTKEETTNQIEIQSETPSALKAENEDEKENELKQESKKRSYSPIRAPLEKKQEMISNATPDFDCGVPSLTLHVAGFVRPFTQPAARQLFSDHGSLSLFWMDAIKSQAYVTFSHLESSLNAQKYIHGMAWPTATSKPLQARFATEEEAKNAMELGEAMRQRGERPRVDVSALNKSVMRENVVKQVIKRKEDNQVNETMKINEAKEDDEKNTNNAAHKDSIKNDHVMNNVNKKNDNSAELQSPLTALFRTTQTQPMLYWCDNRLSH